jgi:hypothetical protein
MACRLPPLGAAVDVTCPPTYSVWRAVVVRHVSDAHVEVRFHHWDGGLDETEDDMVVPATDNRDKKCAPQPLFSDSLRLRSTLIFSRFDSAGRGLLPLLCGPAARDTAWGLNNLTWDRAATTFVLARHATGQLVQAAHTPSCGPSMAYKRTLGC